jgi:hypothetical protein
LQRNAFNDKRVRLLHQPAGSFALLQKICIFLAFFQKYNGTVPLFDLSAAGSGGKDKRT